MGKYGVTWDAAQDGSYAVLEALGVSEPTVDGLPRYATLWRDFTAPVDVSATPYLIRPVSIYGDAVLDASPVRFEAKSGELWVGAEGAGPEGLTKLDLVPWFVQQDGSYLASPWLDFAVDGRHYRLAVESLTFDRGEGNAGPRTLSTIIGQLFSDRP